MSLLTSVSHFFLHLSPSPRFYSVKLLASANVGARGRYHEVLNDPFSGETEERLGVATALLLASLQGGRELVLLLLRSGADVAFSDDLGQNGLHKAAARDNVEAYQVRETHSTNRLLDNDF